MHAYSPELDTHATAKINPSVVQPFTVKVSRDTLRTQSRIIEANVSSEEVKHAETDSALRLDAEAVVSPGRPVERGVA